MLGNDRKRVKPPAGERRREGINEIAEPVFQIRLRSCEAGIRERVFRGGRGAKARGFPRRES